VVDAVGIVGRAIDAEVTPSERTSARREAALQHFLCETSAGLVSPFLRSRITPSRSEVTTRYRGSCGRFTIRHLRLFQDLRDARVTIS
jgi:hypothetical protein